MKVNRPKFIWLIFYLLIFTFPIFSQNNSGVDLVILNAKIRTMDKSMPQAEAVAVNGNKIFAVGGNGKIRALIGSSTKTIDAKGKLLLPGFNDSHVHFTGIGSLFSSMDLRDTKSPQDVVERLKYYVQFLPKGRWIIGNGWNSENWTPNNLLTKELIDAVTPDNPVFLYNINPQTALVNSAALKRAGIDKSKTYPPNSVILDETGEPTGILKSSSVNLVRNFVPRNYSQNWSEIIEIASNYAASLGVTSVQDVHSDTLIETYRELLRQGKLKTRVYDCSYLLHWEKLSQAKIHRADGDSMIRGGCLKYFSEGDLEELPMLEKIILAADKADLQVMMHAIGGKANDIVFTVYEHTAKINGAKDRRFRIEHAYEFSPQDLKRFAASKTIASIQPHLFYGNEPYRALLNSGAILAFGSDASITDFNPLYGIHAAVNTQFTQNGVKQKLTVEEAVRAYTMGSAFAEFQENEKGSISVGKLADFVILSDDIFTIDPLLIKNTKVLTTIVDGKVVFESK